MRDALSYQPHTSLNTPDGPIDVTDPRSQKPFEAVTNLDITTYLDMLPARERTALTLAYGLDGDEPKAHHEIAERAAMLPIDRQPAGRVRAGAPAHTHRALRRRTTRRHPQPQDTHQPPA